MGFTVDSSWTANALVGDQVRIGDRRADLRAESTNGRGAGFGANGHIVDRRRRHRRATDAPPQRSAHPTLGALRVSVVIPTLNEERNLVHVLPHLPPWIHEVVIVDGRSVDGTVAEALRLRPDACIVMEPRPGKGQALFAGIHASSGDIVVTLDADGSMDPTEVPRYVYALLAGADFVKGSRFMHGGGTDDMTAFRRLGNRGLLKAVRRLYGGRFSDLCYGYNAFWRDVVPYLQGRAPGFEIETHMNVRALAAGLRVVEVPTWEAKRVHGVSNLSAVRDGFRVLNTVLSERHTMTRSSLAGRHGRRRLHVPLHQPPVNRRIPDGKAPSESPVAMAPSVSVVVCTHDEGRWADLVRAVSSIRSQATAPAEVIVVVDNNDALLGRARSELIGVNVVSNSGTPGLSGGRNSGLAVAGGDIVAFLDDDAHAVPDWLERLLDAYDSPEVLAVGGAVEAQWDLSRPRWFPEEFDWVVGCTYRGMPLLRGPVRNLIGANMSFRRAVLVEAGGFRSELGRVGSNAAGCEETEVCIRVAQLHPEGRIVYEPAAKVCHRVPADRSTFAYFTRRCLAEGHSKALVAGLVGKGAALASERAYAARVLPKGVARNLARAVRLDTDGVLAASSIVAGVGVCGGGYVRGRSAGPVFS